MLETALELGITYFDVAASYGTAEEAVGHVLGDSRGVVVATKVGRRSPTYNPRKMWLRSVVKPWVDRARFVKPLIRSALRRPHKQQARPPCDVSQETVQKTIELSLERLKRSSVDVLLAHEPQPNDLTPEVASTFDHLVTDGLITTYGVGLDAQEEPWGQFGAIWQSGWPGERAALYQRDRAHVFHGVLRYAEKDQLGRPRKPVKSLIQEARRVRPDSVLLVSASTPDRLRELVESA